MHSVLIAIQVVTSILLSLCILSQSRGEGLGAAIAGTGGGEFHSTRRGAEKFLYRATVFLSFVFALNAFLFAFLPRG